MKRFTDETPGDLRLRLSILINQLPESKNNVELRRLYKIAKGLDESELGVNDVLVIKNSNHERPPEAYRLGRFRRIAETYNGVFWLCQKNDHDLLKDAVKRVLDSLEEYGDSYSVDRAAIIELALLADYDLSKGK